MDGLFEFPITITSVTFVVFVLATLVLYYVFPHWQVWILLITSYLFYATWDWRFALTLLAISLGTYFVAFRLEYPHRLKTASAKVYLRFGLLINLLPLFYFKYLGYLSWRFAQLIGMPWEEDSLKIILPVGLSFYTLQGLSYLLDVYQGQVAPADRFSHLALYLSYFPKLLAGPIERARTFLPQLEASSIVDGHAIAASITRIFIGLVRKLVIADLLRDLIPPAVFQSPERFSASILGFWWFGFVFMIYNDFAGYTSIVRGVSGLFGIRLSENFQQPFFASGVMDLWNRWHITLSHWLRDYVYMPLSRAMLRRNPSGKYLPNIVVPPLVTLLISGLWHGINPHFLVWGGLTGIALVMERLLTRKRPVSASWARTAPSWRGALRGLMVILPISLIIAPPFRMELPETVQFWLHLFMWRGRGPLLRRIFRPVMVFILSLAVDWLQYKARSDVFPLRWPRWAQSLGLAVAILLLFLATRTHTDTSFIYQEF